MNYFERKFICRCGKKRNKNQGKGQRTLKDVVARCESKFVRACGLAPKERERNRDRRGWSRAIEFDVSWLRIFLGKKSLKRPRHDIMNEYYLARLIETSTHLVSEFLWPLRFIVAIKNSKNLLPLFDSNGLVSGMQRTNFFLLLHRWLRKLSGVIFQCHRHFGIQFEIQYYAKFDYSENEMGRDQSRSGLRYPSSDGVYRVSGEGTA